MGKTWTDVDVLGLLDRYESVISSVAFESIEKRVAETCPGKWDQPMLASLRLWMSQTVVQWMLEVFVRPYHPSELVSAWGGPA
jgi:anaphase-promoting complex subunit 2